MDPNSEDSIQVHVRIRAVQPGTIYFDHSPTQIKLGKNSFSFDRIYSPQIDQTEVYSQTGLKSITHAMEGYNSCIFVYGQTGSGKTYTMVGGNGGIIQRAMQHLFYKMSEASDIDYVIGCSYYEIYNQQLFDLLDHSDKKKLNVRQDIKKGIFIQGLHQENIDTSAKGMALLNQGIRSRHVAETQMNRQSSRSHAIFSLNIQSKQNYKGSTTLKSSKLHFVDLAGSERQKTTACVGQRLKEASNINKSLTTLGMVINSLSSQKPKSHIPFRDSKLTLVLRDSLNGNSKTYLIATISSNPDSFQQTLSTLKFAQRAKMVKLRAQINEQSLSMNVQTLKQQIRRLKEQNRTILSNLEIQKTKTKPNQLSNYSQAILTNYNNNVAEINNKINSLVQFLPKVMEATEDQGTIKTIGQNLDQIIELREQILTKAKIENLKFDEINSKRQNNDIAGSNLGMKQTLNTLKAKAKQLGDQILEKEKQKGELFGKLKDNVKQIQVLKQQNQILKTTLQTKQGKQAVDTVKKLLKQKLNPTCANCKQADPFILRLSNEIVSLKKSLNSLKLQHQLLSQEHEFLKISFKNNEEQSQRKVQLLMKQEENLRKQISNLLEKKKEQLSASLTCSINGKQLSVVALSTQLRELENINLELTSEIDVLRQTIEFKNEQIEQFKEQISTFESSNTRTPLGQINNNENISLVSSKNQDFKNPRIIELESQLRNMIDDLSSSKEQISHLQKLNDDNNKNNSNYLTMLEKITDQHEHLIEASSLVELELKKKIQDYGLQIIQKTQLITTLQEQVENKNKQVEDICNKLGEKQSVIQKLSLEKQDIQTKTKETVSVLEQQLQSLRLKLSSTEKELQQSKVAVDIYMNSIDSSQNNSIARTKQAQELRIINHDLTLKNNRYQFVMKQREQDLFLIHNELVTKRKQVVEYVQKFLNCQKQKEALQKQLSSSSSITSSYCNSILPNQSQSQQIQNLKRIVNDRQKDYQQIFRLKKEAQFQLYVQKQQFNKSLGGYMNEISSLKQAILELQMQTSELVSVKVKYEQLLKTNGIAI